jgi:hypothetical protein
MEGIAAAKDLSAESPSEITDKVGQLLTADLDLEIVRHLLLDAPARPRADLVTGRGKR